MVAIELLFAIFPATLTTNSFPILQSNIISDTTLDSAQLNTIAKGYFSSVKEPLNSLSLEGFSRSLTYLLLASFNLS